MEGSWGEGGSSRHRNEKGCQGRDSAVNQALSGTIPRLHMSRTAPRGSLTQLPQNTAAPFFWRYLAKFGHCSTKQHKNKTQTSVASKARRMAVWWIRGDYKKRGEGRQEAKGPVRRAANTHLTLRAHGDNHRPDRGLQEQLHNEAVQEPHNGHLGSAKTTGSRK